MRIDVAKYLGREFDYHTYNCWHFVRDVWLDTTGVDLGDFTPSEITKRTLKDAFEAGPPTLIGSKLSRIEQPESPCVVWFFHPILSHVGVFQQGRVLHLAEGRGVVYEPFESVMIGSRERRFYK